MLCTNISSPVVGWTAAGQHTFGRPMITFP
jgi:hypothetical protein